MSNAFDTQVGGDHYKSMKIQPMEFSMANGLDACQHSIIKYVTRFRAKGGVADLEKARHVIDMLIDLEKNEVKAPPLEGAVNHAQSVDPSDKQLEDALKKVFGQDIEIRRIRGS